jgi:hypothetical protein
MPVSRTRLAAAVFTAASALLPPLAASAAEPDESGFERTEQRADCDDYQPLRKALFGDLHVHSRYSFDAYISSMRRDPWDAYRYAKGEPIILPDPDGEQNISARIERALDFAAVTDHGEYLGPVDVCTQDAGRLGYWWPHCILTRADNLWLQLVAAEWWTSLGGQTEAEQSTSFACTLSDCAAAGKAAWGRIQQAAEDHYDRSAACTFTTFVGYEYTDSPDRRNLHRNVIFRNDRVTEMPVSAYDTGRYNFPALWRQLRRQCLDAGKGCDVMSIPHNPNLSGGLMFRDPRSTEEAEDSRFFETVVELVQHKGASECRYDRLAGAGLATEDEACDFEQLTADNLSMLGSVEGKIRTERARSVPLEEFGRRNMVRNALKDGLALGQKTGMNPFQFGFIGSTDTHSATAGGAEEFNYPGHLGRRDAGFRNVQDHFFSNPGGLAVVWAEENSRDAIFSAIRRRETYATSGTRPTVRFFGGAGLDPDLCSDTQMIERAYADGVPMGGVLQGVPERSSPAFLVSALKDPGTAAHPGIDLQRLQIIKGWVDAAGETHERVFDVAGEPNNEAGVDPDDCTPRGVGAAALCTVWRDPDFDPRQAAFYYARVLENPSCRWSTLQCQAAGVNPFAPDCAQRAATASARVREQLGAKGEAYENCCIDASTQPFYSPTQQERAWTSPIWYRPGPQSLAGEDDAGEDLL